MGGWGGGQFNKFHGQGTVKLAFEPEDATTFDDGKPHTRAFGGIFEDGELIEGWVEFINAARFEGSCHGKCCPTIFKTFKRGKYQWKWGQCTYTGGSFAESFAGKVCCTARIFARARNMPARTCK